MRSLIAVAMLLSVAGSAGAACFEDLGTTGCTDRETFPRSHLRRLSCENLYYVRNAIYDEKGLCFKTKKAQSVFDNSGCYVNDASAIKLNKFEQRNVDRIKQIEREKGC